MKSIALSAFGFSSLVVAGVLEFFAQRSLRQGGLALSTTDSDVPTFVTFSYQFLPTIVAVFYSLAWAWIDSDVRRMQPWLDLSRPGGASGDSTLSVDYPFEFLAFVPFKAWKRRHWPVFLTGTAMMVIFWLITPLQSAIFGMRSVKVSKVIGLRHDVGMIPLQEQQNRIDVSILNLAYATTWLGQSLPAFSTPEASLLPFLPAEEFQTFGSNYTYTGETVEYATDLQCWPAKWRRPSGQETFEADNGRGCLTNVTVPTSHAVKGGDTTVLLYVGWHQDARSDWWLASPTCGPQASNQFLALWTKLDNLQNATLIFCETSYAKQTVSATISGSSHEPLERLPSPVGNLQVLGSDKFNSTAFEYLIGTGVPDNLSHKGIGQVIYLDQTVRLDAYRIAYPFTNMVGFAVGLYKNGSVDDFQNPIVLSKAFRDAHKALFSVAISQLMSPIPRAVEFLGSVDAELFGVVVSRPISLVVEILLVVVAIISGFLLFLCSGYESSLRNDPSSLGSLLEMLRSSESLLGDFTTMDRLNDHDLAEQISQKQYRLEKATPGASGLIPCSQLRRVDQQHETKSGYYSSSSWSSYDYQPVRPKELLPVTGLILITILISATTFLIYLKRQEGITGGLPRPTDSFEVLQILENYLPTIFATFLEPFLVLLTRLACVFQPFHQLKQGKASSQTTLDISYESLPPQLNVLRALRSGSFLLAAMCCLSLLVNILAVGMGAIFNEASAQVGYPAMGRLVREPALARNTIRPPTYSTRYYEAFYILLANTSAGTRLPPWTDSKHVYLPYEYPNNREQDQSLQFHTLTRGFGFDPNCLPLSMSQNDPVHANYSSYYFISSFRNNLLVSFKKENGAELLCYLDPYVIEDNHVQGPASVEMIGTLHPLSNNDRTVTQSLPDDGSCEANFVAVWMKANQSTHGGDSTTTGVLCQPELRTAMFNLTTDRGGYVLDSRRVGGFDDLSKMLSPGQILNLTNEAIRWVGDPDRVNVGPAWHNDTLSRDWLNYLANIELKSTRLVDPREPVVGMEDALAVTTRFFERTSAALLGANLDMFRAINDTSQPVGGVVVRREIRIFMNNPAFLISVVILGINIIALTVLYAREREPYLPRMPSSIASTIAYVAAGRTVAEYRRKGKDERSYGTEDGSIEKMSREPTYSFGHFIGVDGKPHIGIEVDPFVLPLEVSKQNEMSFVSRFFGLRQRKSSDKGQLVSNLE